MGGIKITNDIGFGVWFLVDYLGLPVGRIGEIAVTVEAGLAANLV